jgi:hypothetical protein
LTNFPLYAANNSVGREHPTSRCIGTLSTQIILRRAHRNANTTHTQAQPTNTNAMRIRFARSSDEPVLVDICRRAFFNDDLFGRVIHPHRAQYPEDVSIYWGEWLRVDWENVRNRLIVAVAPTPPTGSSETILGLAVWTRQGTDAGAQKIQREC